MKLNQFLVVLVAGTLLVAGALLLAACENPQLPPDLEDPEVDKPAPDKPRPEPPVLVETEVAVDFQNATPGIVAEAFAAAGQTRSPEAGQLDADAWSIRGFSDGDIEFGQEVTSGDAARGTSPGGETVGGLYAFAVAPDDTALGVQPTSGDFAPGTLLLAVPSPSADVRSLRVGYRLWWYNDQDRSTVWTVHCSADGDTWVELPPLAHATPAAADAEPAWTAADFGTAVPTEAMPTAAGGLFLIRWTAADGEGSGSRDESALDNISLVFTHPQ